MSNFRRRTLSRLAAVQALYQAQLKNEPIEDLLPSFLSDANRLQDNLFKGVDKDLFTRLVKGTIADKSTLDDLIKNHLTANWSFDRLDGVVRVILEAATFELLHMPDTPAPIILNEYIDITDSFFDTPETKKLINGVLDALAKTIRT